MGPEPGKASSAQGDCERSLAVSAPYDFDESLRFVPFGLHDPSCRRGPGTLWKAARTPAGPVTLRLRREAAGVRAVAWGPGAAWAVERAAALAGLEDEAAAFPAGEHPLPTLARRWRGLRLARSPWVFDGLTEYILQQRVTFRDAARAHRRLLDARSEPAPGAAGLRLPLAPAEWLRLHADDWRRAEVDGQRARALRAAARSARRVDSLFDLPSASARSTLAEIPGCGPWTVAITMGFVLGDPDAVPVGDLHLPHEIGWALAGEPRADDRRMLELLEPYRGQRFRVIRLLLAAGRLRLGRGSSRFRPELARRY